MKIVIYQVRAEERGMMSLMEEVEARLRKCQIKINSRVSSKRNELMRFEKYEHREFKR